MGLDRICKGRAPGAAEGIAVMVMVLLRMAGGAGATPHEGASFPPAPADLIMHSHNASMPADFENYSMQLGNYPEGMLFSARPHADEFQRKIRRLPALNRESSQNSSGNSGAGIIAGRRHECSNAYSGHLMEMAG